MSTFGELAAAIEHGDAPEERLARAGVEQPERLRADWSTLAATLGLSEQQRVERLAAVLATARPELAVSAAQRLDPTLCRKASLAGWSRVVRVLGGSEFLSRRLPRSQETLAELLGDGPVAPRSAAHALAAAAALDDGRPPLPPPGDRIGRQRSPEIARITGRDLEGAPLAETARELSDLAEGCIRVGLAALERMLDVEGQLLVIAMGKLGGGELNYSSDVDLIFAFPEAQRRDAGLHERLSRTVTRLRALLGETTAEGIAFRVDLDLRPEGRSGPLVNSIPGLVEWYEAWGRTWERIAWIRARPCAGRLDLGEGLMEEMRPFVYRSYGSYDVIQSVHSLKERIESESGDAQRNVKLGPGGIREAEFVVQALQSLYGGRHPELRVRRTSDALAALAEQGLLPESTAERLDRAYAFLRSVEHRIQMEQDRQPHEHPDAARGWRRLARRMGYLDENAEAAAARLRADLDREREGVREVFESLGMEQAGRARSDGPDPRVWARACGDPKALARRVLEATPAPLRARARPPLERLLDAVAQRAPAELEALGDHPEVGPILGLFCATDPKLVTHLGRRPELVATFRSESLDAANERMPPVPPGQDLESELDGLRWLRQDAFVRVAILRLRHLIDETTAQAALTATADRVLERALELVTEHWASDLAPPSTADGLVPLCVLGLGKLGSQEMTFHSDLDLVFLYEGQREASAGELHAQEYFARLTQRLISYLVTPTGAGRAYEIDTRLRPSGHGGALVASLASFRHYHEKRAQVWEAQALLRARPAAGDASFGERVAEVVHSALFEHLSYPDLAGEIRRMRARMEAELSRQGPDRIDLKYAAGGIVDGEFLAQYLALCYGPRRAELRTRATNPTLDRAGRLGLLRGADEAIGAFDLLRRVESALRMTVGRPDSAFGTRGDVAEVVTRVAGFEAIGDLERAVHSAQQCLRDAFSRTLG